MTDFTYQQGVVHIHIWKTLQAIYREVLANKKWWEKEPPVGIAVLQKCDQCGELRERFLSGYYSEVDGVEVENPPKLVTKEE